MNNKLLAFECDRFGVILQVIRDDLGILEVGGSFPQIAAPSAMPKVFRFLDETRRASALLDWEITVQSGKGPRVLTFAAALVEDRVMVVGAVAQTSNAWVIDELTRINNTHVNSLRELMKARSLEARESGAELDAFMELNNEMAAIQRELAKTNAKLKELNEQKNQLLGIVAHDLRNPIGAIAGYAEFMLFDRDNLAAEHVVFAESIARSASFMLHMVEDLLDLSAIEAGELKLKRKELSLGELAERSLTMLRPLADRKEITLELDVDSTRMIPLDGPKIEQVIGNLISNALKYSHSGTAVRIEVSEVDSELQLLVSDQGQGIPEELLGSLFQPFQTAGVPTTGGEKATGLGLAIARKIVEGHGGKMSVCSTVGTGSTFGLHFPV